MRLTLALVCGTAWLVTATACASGSIGTGQETTADAESGDILSVDNSNNTQATLGQGDLVLIGRGFSSAKDSRLFVAIKDVATNRIINDRKAAYTVESDGSFKVALPNQLAANSNYEVALYADKNDNGFCNAPPLDKSYLFKFTSLTTASVVSIVDTGVSIPVCGYFGDYDFTFDSHGACQKATPVTPFMDR